MKFFSLLIVPAVVIALGCQSAAQPVKDSKPPTKPKAGNEKPAVVEGKYHKVNFKQLSSYAYEVPDDPISDPKTKALMEKNQIPEAIKKLDKQDVAITGAAMIRINADGSETQVAVTHWGGDVTVQDHSTLTMTTMVMVWPIVRMPSHSMQLRR